MTIPLHTESPAPQYLAQVGTEIFIEGIGGGIYLINLYYSLPGSGSLSVTTQFIC